MWKYCAHELLYLFSCEGWCEKGLLQSTSTSVSHRSIKCEQAETDSLVFLLTRTRPIIYVRVRPGQRLCFMLMNQDQLQVNLFLRTLRIPGPIIHLNYTLFHLFYYIQHGDSDKVLQTNSFITECAVWRCSVASVLGYNRTFLLCQAS